MAEQVPLVDYLVLGDDPHLVANECTACGARFFDRRNACASLQRHRVHATSTVADRGRGAGVHDRVVRRARRPGAVRGRRSSTATARACGATSSTSSPTPSTCSSA